MPRDKSRPPARSADLRAKAGEEGQRLGELYWHRPELLGEDQMLSLWRSALSEGPGPGRPSTLQVYVHVPFCESRCRFCWYFSTVLQSQSQLESYVASIERHLDRFDGEVPARRASNAYVGGGTPSILPAPLLGRLLGRIASLFRPKHQFCMEANPGSLDEAKIEVLAQSGLNRVSLGVQSFDADTLRRICRRIVPVERVNNLVRELRDEHVLVNLDLQLGLPGQSVEEARRDLALAQDTGADTVTLYRYQTNPGLPVRTEGPLRFSDVFGKPVERVILTNGYLVVGQAEGDEGCSVELLRPGRRTMEAVVGHASWWLRELAGHPSEMPFYQCFDRRGAHLLGLGLGAFSHIQGGGWFREVTSLGRMERGAGPVFCGSLVSELEDARLEVHHRLSRGAPVARSRLGRWLSPPAAAALLRELEESEAAGLLLRRRGRFQLQHGLLADQRRGYLRGLLPRLQSVESASFRHGRWDLGLLARLESLLASARTNGLSVTDDVDLRLIDLLRRHLEKSEAHRRWLALMEVSRVGDALLGAAAVSLPPDAAFFQLDGGTPIGIFATDDLEAPCCARTLRTAFVMCPRPDAPLTRNEERWLQELVSLTGEREGAAGSSPRL